MSDAPVAPGPAATPAPSKRPTLAFQWGVLGIFFVIICVLFTIACFDQPTAQGYGPFDCFGAGVMAVAQAMWVTMDSKRLGRTVGWWRFGVILFGPLAVWAYLVAAYRERALLWIPVSIVVYALAFLVPWAIALLLWPEG